MKKTYINPDMEVIKITMTQQMLAGSQEVDKESTPIDDPDDIGGRFSDLDDEF